MYPQLAQIRTIPQGDAGTVATLRQMAEYVRARRVHPDIRALAESIVQWVPEKDAVAEAAALHSWVRDNIRYTSDIAQVETLKDPLILLQSRHGDCDDKTMLVASLLQSVGFPVQLVAVSFDRGEFSHVYCETFINDEWVAVETTENVPLGWFAPDIVRRYNMVI